MTDQITPRSEDRIVAELSAMRQAMDSMKSTMEDKFEIALKPIERGLRSITLIPLALIFGGLSSWLFYQGKISESTWFWLTVFLMMPFFGEGARLILDKLPLTKATAALKVMIVCVGIILLSSCSALNDYDRSLALVANVNEQTGAIEYSIVPAAKLGEGRLGAKVRIEGSLADGKQIIRLER